jgi:hypothetical protein
MRPKKVDVTGTITVVEKTPGQAVVENAETQKKLNPWEYCHYCGKVPDGMWSQFALEPVPGGTYWDRCEAGKVAGVLEIIRLDCIAKARMFQGKYESYKEHRPCPKCGNEHRTTEYKTGGGQIYGALRAQWAFIHPYIERLCGRCTFHTYEVPLDFDPEAIFPPE